MGKRARKSPKAQAHVQELVVVSTVDTSDDAKDCETLLKNNDIPATIKQRHDEVTNSSCYDIMVPEEMVDEAHVVIESQDAYDDFYDFASDENEEEDFQDDLFDDEF